MALGTTAALIIGGAMLAGTVASSLLAETPEVPKAEIPAVAASGARQDTGAQVKLGVSDIKDQRVSGSRAKSSGTSVDVLGGLGGGGLSV